MAKALSEWAKRGQAVWDKEFPLVYVKDSGRRGRWASYAVERTVLRRLPIEGRNAESLRESTLREIGMSIQRMVLACHPAAAFTHLTIAGGKHACGAPYELSSAYTLDNTTCPLCLAVHVEKLRARMAEMDPALVAKAEQEAAKLAEWNRLGKVVNGEKVTDHDV